MGHTWAVVSFVNFFARLHERSSHHTQSLQAPCTANRCKQTFMSLPAAKVAWRRQPLQQASSNFCRKSSLLLLLPAAGCWPVVAGYCGAATAAAVQVRLSSGILDRTVSLSQRQKWWQKK